jgi:hypothetical protein
MGSVDVTNPYTLDLRHWVYALFIERETGYRCFVGESAAGKELVKLQTAARQAVARGDAGGLLDEAAGLFPRHSFRLVDLIPEDRERVLRKLAANKLEALDDGYRKLYLETRDLLRMMAESSMEATQGLLVPARAALTRTLLEEIDEWDHSLDAERLSGIRNVLAEASYYGVPIDKSAATEAFTELITEKIESLSDRLDPDLPEALLEFVSLIDEIDVTLDEGLIQNVLYPLIESRVFPLLEKRAPGAAAGAEPDTASPGALSPGWGESGDLQWAVDLLRLAQRFNFNVDRWIEIAPAPTEPAGSGGGS